MPQNDKYYILKWVGSADNHASKEEDYSLKLVMSPLKFDLKTFSSVPFKSNRFDYHINHSNVIVDSLFGLTPFTSIGSVWCNGQRVISQLDLDKESFTFNYDPEKHSNANVFDYDNDSINGSKLIPSSKWCISGGDLDKAGNLSGFIRIYISKNLELIIPHFEIMRNCYAESSTLAIYFAGGYLANDESFLYDNEKSFVDPFGLGNLYVPKHIAKEDIKTLSQYAFDKKFKSRAINHRNEMFFDQYIGNLATHTSNTAAAPSQIKLPVDGRYEIDANGIWVHHPSSKIRRFMVINLLKMNYSLPFTGLNMLRGDKTYINKMPKKKKFGFPVRPKNTMFTNESNPEAFNVMDHTDPNEDTVVISESSQVAVKPMLESIKVKNIRDKQAVKKSRKTNAPPLKVNPNVSTGVRGKSNSNLSKLEIVVSRAEPIHSRLNEILDKFNNLDLAVTDLSNQLEEKSNKKVIVKPFESSPTNNGIFHAPEIKTIINEREYIHSWSYIDHKKQKRRLIKVVELQLNAFNFYIFEFESKTDADGIFLESLPCFIYYQKDGSIINKHQLHFLIESKVRYKSGLSIGGWWGKPDMIKPIIKNAVNHRFHKTALTSQGLKKRIRVPISVSSKSLSKSLNKVISKVS